MPEPVPDPKSLMASGSRLLPAALLGLLVAWLALHAGLPRTRLLVWPVWMLAPGFVVLRLTAPRTLDGWTTRMLLSLAVSPAVSGFALLAGAWFIGWPLERASGAVLIAVGVGLAACVALPLRAPEGAGTTGQFWPVGLLVALFVPAQIWSLARPIHRLSVHGIFHGAYIGEVLAGVVPPHNPVLAELPANNYWAYHLYLAALSQTTGCSYIDASAVTQVLLLPTYLGLVLRFVSAFFPAPAAVGVAILAALGANLVGPLALAWRVLGGFLRRPLELGAFLGSLGHGLDPLLHAGILVKFLTFNGFTHGLVFWALLLYAWPRREFVLVSLALLGTLLFHPSTAIAALTAVPLASVVALALEGREAGAAGLARLLRREVGSMSMAFGVPVLLVAPYVLQVGRGLHGSPVEVGPTTWALWNFSLLYAVLLPLAAVGAWACPRRDASRSFVIVLLGAMAALSLFVQLPWQNQYKFMYLTSLPMAVAAWWGLQRLSRWTGARVVAVGGTVLVLLAGANATAVSVAWAALPWFDQSRIHAEGLSIVVDSQPLSSAIMRWLRENTPARAVVVEKVDYCERSLAGAIAHRQSLYVPCYLFTEGYAETAQRAALIEALFTPGHPKADAVATLAATVSGPLYLVLIREQVGQAFDALVAELEGTAGLRPVHRGTDGLVFAVSR